MVEPVTAEAPPLPRPRLLRQSWLDLTFIHWAVDPASIAHFYPAGTRPDTFEGRAYVGLIPFRMAANGFARGPVLLPDFLETNIRLYSVDDTGRRGVVFLSLDANRRDVVTIARTIFALPYRHTPMQYEATADTHTYTTQDPSSRIAVQVGAPIDVTELELFLTARWGLHTRRLGRTWYLPNEHAAWELRSAEILELEVGGLLTSVGLPDLSTNPPDHVAHSPGVRSYFGLPTGSAGR
ncbi:YqjF family protein [Kribbella endophytica]